MSGKVVGMAFECEVPLTATERYVLVAFADNADQQGKCWPDPKTIVDKTGLGKSSVYRAKDRLVELGLFSEGEDEKGRRCFWLHLSHSGKAQSTGPTSGNGASDSRSGTGIGPTPGTPIPQGDADSHSGTPYIEEPSRTVTEPNTHIERETELPPGVLEAVAAVAAYKRQPVPDAADVAAVVAEFPDHDHTHEAGRFRRYYLAGRGRPRSLGDPVDAWRRHLAGAPVRSRRVQPIADARADRGGARAWAAEHLPDCDPDAVAHAFEWESKAQARPATPDEVRARLERRGRPYLLAELEGAA